MEKTRNPCRNHAGISTEFLPLNFTDIISGIIVLASDEGDTIPVKKIHSVLFEMMPHEPILSGLHFSLKGHICYSGRVDRAISNLVDWRSLKFIDSSMVVMERSEPFHLHLSRFLTKSQLNTVHSSSLRFHCRLRWGNKQISMQAPEQKKEERKYTCDESDLPDPMY